MTDQTPSSRRPGFLAARTGWPALREVLLLEPLPGGARWAATLGSLLLLSFLVQAITGVLLAMNYAPSVDTAWHSARFIQDEVFLGRFIRSVHHWGASAMIILLLLHLVQVFVWGAYKAPREFTWVVGVLLLLTTMGLGFTGYLLPWDERAYWATKVGLGLASMVPGVGDSLRGLLQGGPQIGNLTLTRFFTLHTLVLPGALIALAGVHLYLFRLHGTTPDWWQSEQRLRERAQPFWPAQACKDAVVALLLLAALGLWCWRNPAPLGAAADPGKPFAARPEWYFMFFFELLKVFQGRFELVGTFVLPAASVLVLLLWPFLDRSPRRNPARRPVAILLLMLGTTGLVGLTIFAVATDVRMEEPPAVLAKARPVPEPPGLLQRVDVANLYATNCQSCHGVDGSGNLLRIALPMLPDFTSLPWQRTQTEAQLLQRIREGKPPQMPAFGDKLSDGQIASLAIYVRAFAIGSAPLPSPLATEPADDTTTAPADAPATAPAAVPAAAP